MVDGILQCLPMLGMLWRRRSIPTGLQRLFNHESLIMMMIMMMMRGGRVVFVFDSDGYFSNRKIDSRCVVVVDPCRWGNPSLGSGRGRGRNLRHHHHCLVVK